MRSEELEGPRELKGHSLALPLARMSPGYASSEHMGYTLNGTFVSLTPVAGSLTFSVLANITRRDRAHQQRVRFRALDRRDPSTMMPNHPLHTARVARMPSASARSHC